MEDNMALYAFDGTWNSDEVDDVLDTNVVRFKELYMGNNSEYLEGVGTRFGKVGSILGGLFGTGGRSRIDEMYDELCENWERGDKIIDIIGFSRGAALAVHFANKLGKEGVVVDKGSTEKATIRFLGLWDIVGSFGLSFNNILDFQEINLGWNIDTIDSCVENCFHAMALDERREAFGVTRLDPNNKFDNINEVWFRGVHSDVGGGNENVLRSNIALNWMINMAKETGLPINRTKAELPRYKQTDQEAPVSENKDLKVDPRREVLRGDSIHPTALPKKLEVGDSYTCKVFAAKRFNWSGVMVEKGGEYSFTIPEGSIWKDASLQCGPSGWATEELPWYKESIVHMFENFRRYENANWFALIGALEDEDDNLFFIGNGEKTYTAPADGNLYLFANDMLSKYDNNEGSLRVTITRKS